MAIARIQRKWQIRGTRADGGRLAFPVLAYDHAEAAKLGADKAKGGFITDVVLMDRIDVRATEGK